MSNSWSRQADTENAVDAILDAAGRAFDRHGVARTTMVDVAAEAGCSRATLYRYFSNADALREAFVHRGTLRMAQALSHRRGNTPGSPAGRVLAGLAAVRNNPSLAVWFEPENLAVPLQVSQRSDLLHALAVALLDEGDHSDVDRSDLEMRGEWLQRAIISLLAMPPSDPAHERALVEEVLLPSLMGTLRPMGRRRDNRTERPNP